MALKLEEIRALAERVAASHALEVVDLEYLGGGGKHRTLRVFIEKNAVERARLRERLEGLLAADEQEAAETPAAAGLPQSPRPVGEVEPDETLDRGSDGEFDAEDGELDGELDGEFDADGELSEEDAALLEGLPSVANMELLSGITHQDCENFSRDFGTVLDVEELVPGTEYLLEISSPGLDRRLRGEAEYRRFAGSLAKLQTFEPVEGNRHWQGRLTKVQDGHLVLDLQQGEKGGRKGGKGKKGAAGEAASAVVEIALSNIERAQLVPEF